MEKMNTLSLRILSNNLIQFNLTIGNLFMIRTIAKWFATGVNSSNKVKKSVAEIVEDTKTEFKTEAVIAMLEAKRAELIKAKPALISNTKKLNVLIATQKKQLSEQSHKVTLLQNDNNIALARIEETPTTTGTTIVVNSNERTNPINTIVSINNQRISLINDKFIPVLNTRINTITEQRDNLIDQYANMGNVLSSIDANIAYLKEVAEFAKFNNEMESSTSYFDDAIALDKEVAAIVEQTLIEQNTDTFFDNIEKTISHNGDM